MLGLDRPLVSSVLLVLALISVGCDSEVDCEPTCTGAGGIGGEGTTSSGGGSGGTGEGGGDAGGGGAEPVWTIPACDVVVGIEAVALSLDAGATLIEPESAPRTATKYAFGIVTSPKPNTLFVDYDGKLFRSEDAGCSFAPVAFTGTFPARLESATDGSIYGWVENDSSIYRFTEVGLFELTSPAPYVVGLQVDAIDPTTLRAVASDGTLWQSGDAGSAWQQIGTSPIMSDGLVYRADFDPNDPNHVLLGCIVEGIWTTRDGGETWTQATGLSTGNANGFTVEVSPVDGEIVWAEGIDLTDDTRHVYRSEDGGETFEPVVDQSPDVTLTNGVPMWPHPTDPDVVLFEFGTYYANYGTDLYRYDHTTGTVTTNHFDYDDVYALAFSPVDPDVLYLGLSFENIE